MDKISLEFRLLSTLLVGQKVVYSYSSRINIINLCFRFIVLIRSTVTVTVDLILRSWVRFPPRSKDFFFASCSSLVPFTRANAQCVIHGFK